MSHIMGILLAVFLSQSLNFIEMLMEKHFSWHIHYNYRVGSNAGLVVGGGTGEKVKLLL